MRGMSPRKPDPFKPPDAFAALDREEDLSQEQVAAINESYARVTERLERPPLKEDR
jgi:hypothetical protein